MKIFVLTRKTLMFALLLLLLGAFSVPTFFKSVETSVQTKELPIYSVETEEKKIAITFDSAWNDDDIDQIIQVLSEKNCPSTFFVTGDWAERFPESLKKLYNAGHEIASTATITHFIPPLPRTKLLLIWRSAIRLLNPPSAFAPFFAVRPREIIPIILS